MGKWETTYNYCLQDVWEPLAAFHCKKLQFLSNINTSSNLFQLTLTSHLGNRLSMALMAKGLDQIISRDTCQTQLFCTQLCDSVILAISVRRCQAATLRQLSNPCAEEPLSNTRSGGLVSLLLLLLYARAQQDPYQLQWQAKRNKIKHFLPSWNHLVGACTDNNAEEGVKMVKCSPRHRVQCCSAELCHQSWSPMHFVTSPVGSRRRQSLKPRKHRISPEKG